jgi:hypothetical protein
LGIEIKGHVKGLDISYEVYEKDDALNTTGIGSLNETMSSKQTQSVGSDGQMTLRSRKRRDALLDKSIKSFDFSLAVNKYSSQNFVIKNNSGIPTKFKLELKDYPPLESSLTEMDLMMSSSFSKQLNDTYNKLNQSKFNII